MRMRKKKNGDKRMASCNAIHVVNPAEQKGKWQELSKGKEMYAEIGCGKGRFILELAKRNPDKFFIGFEKIADVIVLAMEKVKEAELQNVVFVCDDAERLLDIFEESELDGMYLNFSDPWFIQSFSVIPQSARGARQCGFNLASLSGSSAAIPIY